MAVSSSSSVSDVRRWKYDVFVSFGHQDTGRDFVSHLIRAFNQKSISTPVDAEGICRDDCPSEELPDAVQHSRLFIVVFSKGYADSRCRLEELVQMLNCVDKNNQKLLPVFYRVDPSDVRRATGAFAEAFQKYECNRVDEEEVPRWRSALTSASNYFGWYLPYYRNEADVIEEIVQSVFDKLICFSSYGSRRKYDVFLNFRGTDTRKSFVVHLYKALYLKVINTFMDGEELEKATAFRIS
ncbi:disease resistance protein Roq1-like [Malus sylvestris]|uniref:disease resistance protein Roq1-like n=1 Tax=Malus sylvestris TaxID=3752 RepID=UPI0004987794|nr:disease resistance protein Roq1-like [Malus sylvestris]